MHTLPNSSRHWLVTNWICYTLIINIFNSYHNSYIHPINQTPNQVEQNEMNKKHHSALHHLTMWSISDRLNNLHNFDAKSRSLVYNPTQTEKLKSNHMKPCNIEWTSSTASILLNLNLNYNQKNESIQMQKSNFGLNKKKNLFSSLFYLLVAFFWDWLINSNYFFTCTYMYTASFFIRENIWNEMTGCLKARASIHFMLSSIPYSRIQEKKTK
jgi:hypothetical protein